GSDTTGMFVTVTAAAEAATLFAGFTSPVLELGSVRISTWNVPESPGGIPTAPLPPAVPAGSSGPPCVNVFMRMSLPGDSSVSADSQNCSGQLPASVVPCPTFVTVQLADSTSPVETAVEDNCTLEAATSTGGYGRTTRLATRCRLSPSSVCSN